MTGQAVPDALIAITTAVNTFYFASVGEENRRRIAAGYDDDDLPPPLVERL